MPRLLVQDDSVEVGLAPGKDETGSLGQRQECRPREILQLSQTHAAGLEQQRCVVCRPLPRVEVRQDAALDERPVEEALGSRRDHEALHMVCASRLAEDRDVARISAKGQDVVAHPFECLDDVQQGRVAATGEVLAADIGEIEEPQHTQAVLDRHNHDIAASRQSCTVVLAVARAAADVAAAVDPHHHRSAASVGRGCPHAQCQTVLVHHVGTALGGVEIVKMRASWREVVRATWACPGLHRCGRLEPQRSHRGCRERQAEEGLYRVTAASQDGAATGLDPNPSGRQVHAVMRHQATFVCGCHRRAPLRQRSGCPCVLPRRGLRAVSVCETTDRPVRSGPANGSGATPGCGCCRGSAPAPLARHTA